MLYSFNAHKKESEYMQENKYIYPVIITKNENNIAVNYPDFPDCKCENISRELNLKDILDNAIDNLGFYLVNLEKENKILPVQHNLSQIIALKNNLHKNQIVIPVQIFMPKYRDLEIEKAVNKTVTMPKWLLLAGQEFNLNFSHIMQDALMQKLNITRKY